uniref:Pentatricopeptide repeat-containing protein n=1 Tax=Zea mays TaxID=4577 RepID=A0A804MJR2_MAIZE
MPDRLPATGFRPQPATGICHLRIRPLGTSVPSLPPAFIIRSPTPGPQLQQYSTSSRNSEEEPSPPNPHPIYCPPGVRPKSRAVARLPQGLLPRSFPPGSSAPLQARAQHLADDTFVFTFVLKACAGLGWHRAGAQLHALVVQKGFEFHAYVHTALINVYVMSRCLVEARKVFDEMLVKNVVSWNVMITGFAGWDEVEYARLLFD